jgi:hypothetical protein
VSNGIAATLADDVGSAQASVSSQNNTLDALGVVIFKIDVFVKIVDQATRVRGQHWIKFLLADACLGASVRHTGVGNCVFCIQGELENK